MTVSDESSPSGDSTTSPDPKKLPRPPDGSSPEVHEQMSPLLEVVDEMSDLSNTADNTHDNCKNNEGNTVDKTSDIHNTEHKVDMKCIEQKRDCRIYGHEIDPRAPGKKSDCKNIEYTNKHGVLSPNHKELVEAGSSLGSISLPPQHIALHPNHQELIWAGSSLGTMHKLPLQAFMNKDSNLSIAGSHSCGLNRAQSALSMKSKLSMCRFGSQTVSESGTDMFTFCRICQMSGDEKDPLFSPCRCCGSLRYIHASCLKKWIRISARRAKKKPPRCELCHYQYNRHKHFKFSQWRWPRVNARDKILHILFLVNLLVMVGCAIATVMCFLSDRGHVNRIPNNKVKLTTEEIITLTCGVMFFVAFFIAMTVEIKARHTLYKLFLRFIMHNTEWTVETYDRSKDPLYKNCSPPAYV